MMTPRLVLLLGDQLSPDLSALRAADFDELEITEIDGDAHVAFARTEITLRDVDIADLGPGDFLFT